MGHGSGVKRRSVSALVLAAVLFAGLIAWTSMAIAGQASAKTAEPKRGYGSIDVIMYQTSW